MIKFKVNEEKLQADINKLSAALGDPAGGHEALQQLVAFFGAAALHAATMAAIVSHDKKSLEDAFMKITETSAKMFEDEYNFQLQVLREAMTQENIVTAKKGLGSGRMDN